MNRLGFLNGFGEFGKVKGAMTPPPIPPPTTAMFKDGQWSCENSPQPQEDAVGSYFCCPSGWTRVKFGDINPCIKERGAYICGPLPDGASKDTAVCCEEIKEWVPKDPSGDSCIKFAQASGRALPGVPEMILAPDIQIDRTPLISSRLMMIGGVLIALLFIITMVFKLIF